VRGNQVVDESSVVTRQVWYEADAASPRLAPEAGLDFETTYASGPAGRTAVIHASWSLPKKAADALPGGRVTAAVQIVAVDLLSGRAYARNAERRPSGDSGPAGPAGHFNVDLVRHLALPLERRHYAVFLWLDERTSPLRTVAILGDEPEKGIFEFQKVEGAARRKDPEILLAGSGAKVQGTARLAPTRVAGKGPVFLTALALGKKTRELRSLAQALPEELSQAGELTFELDPAAVAPEPACFLVAVLRAVKSNVLARP
jgi:hypothetical protein